mmetsp:Transcript_3361/g.10555  ORF Transcript_3361/g.10555 Transcript_3361/m.10555 type:complete len:893 (-) Transcript_3361:53-2731(-)
MEGPSALSDHVVKEVGGKIEGNYTRAGDVRVEGEDSIGRSYAMSSIMLVPGLGAKRRLLRTRTHDVPTDKQVVHSLPNVNTRLATRDQVLAYFRNTWDLDATLFSALRDDSVFYSTPDTLRRPLIFYFGHTAAVYINKLVLAGLGERVNPLYEKMFETGVDELSWDNMEEMNSPDFAWPTVEETVAFRERVKAKLEALVGSMPEPATEGQVGPDSPWWAMFMGFDHERIHLETSSVLIRQLPVDAVRRPERWLYAPSHAPSPDRAPANTLVTVPAATVVLGKPNDFPSFGWDNEYGERRVLVPEFRAAKFLTTNAEFLPFVLGGGYRTRRWWVAEDGDDEGWRWVQYRNATHPSFWVATAEMPEFIGGRPGRPYQKDDGRPSAGTGAQFRYRAMFDIIDMPWDWPVEVNYLEAKAFCRWKSAQDGLNYRIITEAEHHRLRGEGPRDGEPQGAHGDLDPDLDPVMRAEVPGNSNMRFGSSSPVDMFPPSPTGFHDVHGNVWEWVEDHFAPLPGFRIHPLYDDFSTPCFDGWHTEIVGGSWVSTGDQASRFARYHFRRHFFQHLGFRYAVTSAEEEWPGASTAANLWEGQTETAVEAANHFPDSISPEASPIPASLSVADATAYPQRLAALVWDAARTSAAQTSAAPAPSALHVGSGLGGASFALAAAGFLRVVATDAREAVVRNARVLQHHGELGVVCHTEGLLGREELARVPVPPKLRARLMFVHAAAEAAADAPDVRAAAPFDAVVVDGVLDRMRQPLALVDRLPELVRPGGVLVVASANDWSPTTTPRNAWLGGFKMNGEAMTTLDMLQVKLGRGFRLCATHDVPRIWRQNARVATLELRQVSVWRREAGAEGAEAEAGGGAGGAPLGSRATTSLSEEDEGASDGDEHKE